MAEIDLDRLAAAYDHRPDRGAAGRIAAVLDVADLGASDLAIDVGGGRGRQAAGIAAGAGCRVVVVDPSRRMVTTAAARGVVAVRGRGEELPFCDGAASLALFHLSIHHGDWRTMLAEAWRVLAPGGTLFVWTMDPEYHRTSFLARWFPRIGDIDAERFPAIDRLRRALEELGGRPQVETHTETMERSAGEWVVAVRAGFVSTLHLLSHDEIEAGIERFRAAHPDPAEMIRYPLRYTSVSSPRPPIHS